MSSVSSDGKPGLWARLWQPPRRKFLLGIPLGGFVFIFVGIILWGAFNTVLEATNHEEFCIGCHEMRDNPYPEYKETIHYTNRTGVRATCPDCHVPHNWFYKVARKAEASLELWDKLVGTIDTREKFEAHRWELAQGVWKVMKETDSRECRNCHSWSYMDVKKQSEDAQKEHGDPDNAKKSCIDCHKGIAHHMPKPPKKS